MSDIDNKVVSISFNNKQFLKDVADTITVIEDLNEATSGKKIDSSGIENLGRAFRNTTSDLTDQANSVVAAFQSINSATNTNFQTGGIDALRKALENTGLSATDVEDTITSLQQLSRTGISYASDLGVNNTAAQIQNASSETRSILTQDIDDVSQSFSAMEMIALGAMIAIGEKAADIGANALRSLTAGIRDGWGEYNALTNSTQTILVNTQRWGSTMEDVSGALEELNKYADLTTYSFSDMTRNIGYFTTAGVELEDSVTAIQGLSNVGAMFGADAQSVARAGYQISQAMSAGVIKLMDWRSMINAGMGGQALQDELIRTAAVMSGISVDAMNDYIDSLGGFNASLQEGWLTSDVFLEAMRVFAGQSREYYESLTDENGNRLYSDEEIDRLVELGETAMESATQVRTLQQMIDAFKESIGSGWQRTFTMIIGNLEEAKEFWTPINNILTGLVNGFFDVQNGALELWRTLGGREELLEGINNTLTALSNVLGAIGRGFIDAFGGTNTIGSRLMGITEALTDFSESLILSEEELGFLQDFFTGIFEPISLVVDIIFELIKAFFDAGDSALNLEHSADTLYSTFGEFRYALLSVLGYIGSVLKAGAKFIRNSRVLRTVIQTFVRIVGKAFKGLTTIISAPFVLLYQIWERYNLTEKLNEFATRAATFFLPLVDALSAAKTVFVDWFDGFIEYMGDLIKSLDPIETFIQVFSAIKQLFRDLFDPTVSIRDAFSNFFSTLSDSNIVIIFEAIRSKVSELWTSLKETGIGQWFEDIGTKIQNAAYAFSQTAFGQKILEIGNSIRDFLSLDTGKWDIFWTATEMMLTDVADNIAVGWDKIKTFFTELIAIIKDWFGFSDGSDGTVGDAINDTVGTADEGMMNDKIETLEKTGQAVAGFMETTSKAVYEAEKLIPNAEESKFLSFLRELPSKLTLLMESVGDGTIIEKTANFFKSITDTFMEFFSNDVFEMGSSVFEWFSNIAINIGNTIASFIGIDLSEVQDGGVLSILGALIRGIVNAFTGIDKGTLFKIDAIIDTVSHFLMALSALKVVSIISEFSKGLNAALQGYKIQQQAKKMAALAEVLKSVALVVIGIGAVVAFIALALNQEWVTPSELISVFAGIMVTIAIIWSMVMTIMWQAEKIEAAQIKNVSKILSTFGSLLITIVLSIAAVLGMAYIAYKIYTSSDIDSKTFGWCLGIIGGAFVILVAVAAVLIGLILKNANKLSGVENALKAVSSVMHAVTGLLVGITILLAGILAAIAAFTFFIEYASWHDMQDSLLWALGAVAVVLLMAAGAIFLLTQLAKKMSSGVSGVKPSQFKNIIKLMTGLLLSVMVSITVLIAAVGIFVHLITTSGANVGEIMLAAGIVIGLVLSVFGGLSLLFNSLKNLTYMDKGRLWNAVAVMAATMIVLGAVVGLIVTQAAYLAGSLTDITTFWHTLAGMGAALIGIIGAAWVLYKIIDGISEKGVNKNTWKAFALILSNLAVISVIIVGIGHVFKSIITALGQSGLTGASTIAIAGALSIMLIVMTLMTTALLGLASMPVPKGKILTVWVTVGVIAAALMGIAFALSTLADIDASRLILAGGTLYTILALGVLLVGLLTLLGALLPGGTGIAAMAVAAITIVAFAASMLTLSAALMISAKSFDTFANSLDKLAKINGNKIRNNFRNIARAIPDALLAIAGGIVAANEVIIGAGATIGNAVATAIFTAISVFSELIQGNIVAITTAISSVIIGVIKANLYAIRDFIAEIIQPGSVLWDIIAMLGSFALSAAETFGYYGFTIAVKFLEGIVKGIYDSGFDTLISQAINHIWTSVKQTVNEMFTWLDQKMNDFFAGANAMIIDSRIEGYQEQLDAVNDEIHSIHFSTTPGGEWNRQQLERLRSLQAQRADIMENMAREEGNRQMILDYNSAENDRMAAELEAENAQLDDIASTVDAMLDEEYRLRNIGDNAPNYTGYSTYIPDQYRGAGMDFRREAEQTSSGFSILGQALRGFLGIDPEQSIGDTIRGWLGLSEGDSIVSVLTNALGIGGVTGAFNLAGEDSGVSFVNGFNTSIDTSSFNISSENLLPDDVMNPVITPVIDDSQVSLGIANIEDMFHNAIIDEFAIDAGNSMLVREQAEGDATADGSVTYNYTQINNSPKALSAIEIYRDTNNLLRGRVSTT